MKVLKAIPLFLAVLGVVSAIAILTPADAEFSHCEQGTTLQTARLLEEAAKQYGEAGGEECGPDTTGTQRQSGVSAELAVADSHFAAGKSSAEAKKTGAAIDSYIAGLAINPFDASAREALGAQLREYEKERAGQSPCEVAGKLAAAGLHSDAAAVVAGADAAATEECGKQIEAGQKEGTEKLASAFDLRDAGDEKGAAKAYAEALALDPQLDRAKSGLETTLSGESRLDRAESRITDTVDDLEAALKWFVPLLVALLAAALLLWIGLRRLAATFPWTRRTMERLGGAYGFSALRKAAMPRLQLDEFSGDKAEAFKGLLSDSLTPKGAEEQPEFPLDRVSETTDEGVLEAASKLAAEIEKAKLLGNFLTLFSKLFRRRSARLAGEILPEGDRGLGAILSLEGTFRDRKRTVTIWEDEFDRQPEGEAAARSLRLVPPATAWAQWQLFEYMQPERQRARRELGDGWLPRALFQAAVARESEGEPVRAATLYEDALEHDPGLAKVSTSPMAAHNLAKIENRAGRHEQAAARVAPLQDKIAAWRKRETADGWSGKRIWGANDRWTTLECACLYTQALAQAYTAAASKERPDKAKATAERLLKTLDERIASGLVGEREIIASDLKELRESRPPAQILLAKLKALCDPEGAKQEKPAAGPLSRRARYNLACYQVALAGLLEGRKDTLFDSALEALDRALSSRELHAWAKDDPSLKPLREERKDALDKILARHEIKPRAKKREPPAPDSGQDDKPETSLADRLAALLGID